jgi:plastocyanin
MKREEPPPRSSIRKSRPFFGVAALLATLALATACGSDSSGGGSSPSSPATAPASSGSGAAVAGSTVDIKSFMFTPKTLTVRVGTTVT